VNRPKLLLDQMIDAQVAIALDQQGWDVVRVSELGLATADDDQILAMAISQDRVLVTLDEHFGDWAVLPLESHPGVVRLKVSPTTSPNILALLVPFLNEHKERSYVDHLVIVKPSSNRWIRTSR
jgi:predicted nuclease of predicted toxin-antitoxin system